jgi:hypothetical protein
VFGRGGRPGKAEKRGLNWMVRRDGVYAISGATCCGLNVV